MPNYPSGLFADKPNVQMMFHSSGGTGAILWSVGAASSWDATQKPDNQYLMRPVSSDAVTGEIHI